MLWVGPGFPSEEGTGISVIMLNSLLLNASRIIDKCLQRVFGTILSTACEELCSHIFYLSS